MSFQRSAGRQGEQYRNHDKMRSEVKVKCARQGIERKSEVAAKLGSFDAEESLDDEFLRKVERRKKSMRKKEQDLGAKKSM